MSKFEIRGLCVPTMLNRDDLRSRTLPFKDTKSKLNVNKPCAVERGLRRKVLMHVDAFEKCTDPCQPVQSLQADLDQNFSLSATLSATLNDPEQRAF